MEAEESIRHLQKMEAVGQLTGGIAHDFNNLLTGISGSLELIRRRLACGRSAGLDRFIDSAIASAHRAAALTQRLLAFARRQSLDVKPHDLNQLIDGLGELLHRTLGETIHLKARLGTDLWPALTDANQFESSLLNLVINARDAMPNGGNLTIETANVGVTDKTVAAGDLATGDYVMVAVSDDVSGMPADVVARAFDPFFTTKPIGLGTGLGLSMIYGFVRQSGGDVKIFSEVGIGTTVKLYLPRAMSLHAEDCGADTAEPEVPTGAGETVLVVEDEPGVRLLIAEVLSDLGYRKFEVADASAAVRILESRVPIDLLITDVGLPDINGRQLAEIALLKRPGLKVLFVTGYAEETAARGGFLAPGMEMMTKPFALDALAAKVRGLVAGGEASDP